LQKLWYKSVAHSLFESTYIWITHIFCIYNRVKINSRYFISLTNKSINFRLFHACIYGAKCQIYKQCQRYTGLFIRHIIRLFQLIFSARTVIFSQNKSANSVFQPAYQHSRTGPTSYINDVTACMLPAGTKICPGISYDACLDVRC
jgi:hypothetical protein